MDTHQAQSKPNTLTSSIFFIKEKVDSKDVIVEYCPTKHMWADFFTKPLHGNLFKRLQS